MMMKICYFFCINMLLMFVQLYTVYNVDCIPHIYIYIRIYIYTLPKCYLEPVSLFLYKTFFFGKSRKQERNQKSCIIIIWRCIPSHTHTHTTISFLFNLSTNRTTFPIFFLSISVSILSNIIILCMFVFNALVYYPLPNLIYNEPNCNTTRKLKS